MEKNDPNNHGIERMVIELVDDDINVSDALECVSRVIEKGRTEVACKGRPHFAWSTVFKRKKLVVGVRPNYNVKSDKFIVSKYDL